MLGRDGTTQSLPPLPETHQSLIQYGLTSCKNGFGNSYNRGICGTEGQTSTGAPSGAFTTRDGGLSFTPVGDATDADSVISQLSLLLTSGRLGAEAKGVS